MRNWFLIMAVMTLAGPGARGAVALGDPFGDYMVLQRNRPVPVWGMAGPGEKVTVGFREQRKETTAGADGKWQVTLEPLSVGPEAALTVNEITLNHVLVGEVWVGAGQSNMANRVKDYPNDAALARAAAGVYPELRLMRMMEDGRKGWWVANGESIPGYSAELFAFGVELQRALGVPVGLMLSAQGGTTTAQWVNESDYLADKACAEELVKFVKSFKKEDVMAEFQKLKSLWEKAPKAEGAPVEEPGIPGSLTPHTKFGEHFDARTARMIPYAMAGVLWDQGESGSGVVGLDLKTMTGALLLSWRARWGEFPFLYLQKPSGEGCAWVPQGEVRQLRGQVAPLPSRPPGYKDGLPREQSVAIMKYPKTTMVTTSDLEGGLHPPDKWEYGARAALVALGAVYGKPVEYIGPLRDQVRVDGGSVRITFKHAEGLAAAQGKALQGFAIAGKDRKFVWAKAVIEGTSVIVSSPEVAEPVAVRYAWGEDIAWANLFNEVKLPAATFRTDDWGK